MKHLTLIVLFLVFVTVPIFGQEKDTYKHPIDIELEKCHDTGANHTTYGMVQCEVTAREEWEKEMEKYYSMLMNILNKEEKEKLMSAQMQWLEFKEKELDFSGTTYFNMQGTMWQIVAASRSCEVVKQRALDLSGYYKMLTFDDEEK